VKIRVVLYCFAIIFVLTSLNVVISVKGQSTVSTPLVAATQENQVSIKLQIPLSYSYAFWSHKKTGVFGTMRIYIRNPTPILETVTITMPGKVDITGNFDGSYETTYNKNMRVITVISISNKVSFSEINFVYSLNNRFILGLAYVHMSQNVISSIEIEGLDVDRFDREIRFFLPEWVLPCQGSPFPPPDSMTSTEIVYEGDYAQNVYPVIWYRSDKSVFISLVYCAILSLVPYTIVVVSKKRKFFTGNVFTNAFGRVASSIKTLNIARMAFFCLILTSVIMLSTVVAIGPNSRPQLMIASEPETAEILHTLIDQDFGDTINVHIYSWWHHGTISIPFSLSQEVDIIVVGKLPLSQVALTDIDDLDAQAIVILKEYSDTPLAQALIDMFSGERQTDIFLGLPLEDLDQVVTPLLQKRLTASRFFFLSESAWSIGVSLVAILSLLLVFFSAFFVVSFAMSLKELTLQNLLLMTGCLGGIFGWIMIVYISSSSGLNLAVSLHAAPTNLPKNLVAMGYLGFGGGSMLRMALGALGGLLAIVLDNIQRKSFNLKLFFPIVAVVLVIINLPVIGPMFDDILLIGIGGEFVPTVTVGRQLDNIFSASARIFFSIFANPDISRGTFMYFLCGVALLALRHLSKNVRTVVIIPLLLFFGRGVARSGDFAVFSFLNTILVGAITGVFLIIILVLIQKIVGWTKTHT
jgi:hypothetical protein